MQRQIKCEVQVTAKVFKNTVIVVLRSVRDCRDQIPSFILSHLADLL